MSYVGQLRALLVLIGCWLMTAGAMPAVAAKNDACRSGCKTAQQACRDAYEGAFQTSKSACTGRGRAKRQCVKTARGALRAGVKACRGFAATCRECCKAGGTDCNVRCGDGVVSGGEACDPPGSGGCAADGVCDQSCRCPSPIVTTTSLATVTTSSAPSTTTTSSTSTTTLPPCSNGAKDGNETAVDCGGGTCAPCADGLACTAGGDCQSKFCSSDVCTDPCPTEPAGTPCADDGNSCTVDTCDGSTCQHTPLEGVVCRPAVGPCDAAEMCDGSGDPCPADQMMLIGEVCRPLQGSCDEEEMCDGVSPECPQDKLLRAGDFCRAPKGVCDLPEACTGTDAACPPDSFLGPETVCRSVDGVCDVAETCSGSSKDCPEDGFQQGNVCRPSAGDCDVAETCSGDPGCPPDFFQPSTTVCRAAAGVCDAVEHCTGTSAVCPENVRLGPETTCRPSAGPCDVAETCSGGSNDCRIDRMAPENTICRPEVGVCDRVDRCDGESPACPADEVTKAGVVCRAANGVCDVAEACDGVSNVCPVDQFEPSTKECRAGTGVCDPAETCSGAAAACPPNVFASGATKCYAQDPANPCDDDIFCHDGGCPLPTVDPNRVCRNVPAGRGGYCDSAEFCVPGPNGVGVCPPDAVKPAGTVCLKTPDDYCREDVKCSGSSKACAPSTAAREPAGTACIDKPTQKDGVCRDGSCAVFGARCTFGAVPDQCGLGQRCINCGAEGAPPEGYCADAERPCCVAGTPFDDVFFWCGETTLGNGNRVPQLCCDFKCSQRDDDQHCGTCDNNCLGDTVGPPGNACFFQPYGGRCNSDTGQAVCTGTSVHYPNQICHADGSIWTWYECDDDADCPSDAICGSAAHDDACGTNRATYGQCVLPYTNPPCFPPVPCQSDVQCPGYPDWSCQEVEATDPDSLITSSQSFCKAGRRCVTDTDCLDSTFISNFCLKSAPGLPGLTTGICSLRNEEEGTFVSLEVPGVSSGACVDDEDCPAGRTCLPSCGITPGAAYANLCNETTICSP